MIINGEETNARSTLNLDANGINVTGPVAYRIVREKDPSWLEASQEKCNSVRATSSQIGLSQWVGKSGAISKRDSGRLGSGRALFKLSPATHPQVCQPRSLLLRSKGGCMKQAVS